MGIWYILITKSADKNRCLEWRIGPLQKPVTAIDIVAEFCLFHMDKGDNYILLTVFLSEAKGISLFKAHEQCEEAQFWLQVLDIWGDW